MKRKPQKTITYNPEFIIAGDRLRWIENASLGLRIVGTAHEIDRNSLALGYYLDPLCEFETVSGAVLQLPGQAGNARFVPAVADPWNDDCYFVDLADVYEAPGNDCEEAKRYAARAADGMAERYAKTEREYQILETAKMRIEEARERIATERKEAHALAVEMRSFANWRNDASPAICKSLHECMTRRRAAVSVAVKEIRDLTRNPFSWLEATR